MIRVRELRKNFGQVNLAAVNDVTIDIPDGAFFSLVGPSGCGKTTTLRCIAGLEQPTSGHIEISGSVVYSSDEKVNVAAHQRKVGMVFQTYAIWPHMTVAQNVAYPLKSMRWKREEIRAAVAEALEMVGLQGEAQRPAPLLSGGQQQRVALARALVEHPQVLLLDEPLSNLDAKLREQMRLELRTLHDQIGFTALYVTHDQDEAFVLSDMMAVMSDGRIIELGSPLELYRSPRTSFGALFLGAATEVTGTVSAQLTDRICRVTTQIGMLTCRTAEPVAPGTTVRVYIRPEEVSLLTPEEPTGPDCFQATLRRVVALGGMVDYWADCCGVHLRARALANEALLRFLEDHRNSMIPLRIESPIAQTTEGGAATTPDEPVSTTSSAIP